MTSIQHNLNRMGTMIRMVQTVGVSCWRTVASNLLRDPETVLESGPNVDNSIKFHCPINIINLEVENLACRAGLPIK